MITKKTVVKSKKTGSGKAESGAAERGNLIYTQQLGDLFFPNC